MILESGDFLKVMLMCVKNKTLKQTQLHLYKILRFVLSWTEKNFNNRHQVCHEFKHFKISCKCFWDFLHIFFLFWLDWHQPLMIRYDWLLLPFPQADDIYLSALSPPSAQLLIIFFHTPTGRFLGKSHLSILNCQSFVQGWKYHVASTAQSCNWNSLTF